MDACRHFGDLDRARAVFKRVYRDYPFADVRCINTLLSLYKDARLFPPAEQLFSFVDVHGISLDEYSFSLLFFAAFVTEQSIVVVDSIVEAAKSRLRFSQEYDAQIDVHVGVWSSMM